MLKSLHTRGISAIPLKGKRPHFSVKWKQFQTTQPSAQLIDDWGRLGFESYGIICGRISQGIIVIDFDCPDLYEGICRDLHYIEDTYTVKTRRGYHVYLKTTFHVASRSFKDCDIKGDGSYVVGAGSKIDRYQYSIYKRKSIQAITYQQYQQIVTWLTPQVEQLTLPFIESANSCDLIAHYKRHLPHGRNNALYATALYARQQGISQNTVIDELAPYHAMTTTYKTHRPETPEQRLQEAQRTIKSAYKYKSVHSGIASSLPNVVRERLLQIQESTIVPRLLDAIQQIYPGKEWITTSQLLVIAKICHISKKSIYRVLCGQLAKVNGKRIFKRFDYTSSKTNKDIYVSQGDMRKPNSRRGRPIQFIYQIPTTVYLCNILKVDGSLSDTLRLQDLQSAGAYRQALHRELIRRLSPMVRVDWLAGRLGVHRRTIFRYNVQLNVTVTPMIQKQLLTRDMVGDLIDKSAEAGNSFTPGVWIETRTGKRYPAIQSIANIFVTQVKEPVWLCNQLPSKYSLEADSVNEEYDVELPDHLKTRATMLTYANVATVLPPDWAMNKYDIGGYLAVWNGYKWTFRPPLRVIAYPLVKTYEDGLVYYVRPL